ncbi:hemerythrin domain-containing protein [uncultured Cohaesibacter sp.]|uniref:bacteriohemerythrin n=1 Tax=uncultured Cohaesibacter sp. TaxID=1002546 RepID=UPI00292D8A07|nr:hemerythrin domain-containing protein [uncultured Cohaesibacter sp.]
MNESLINWDENTHNFGVDDLDSLHQESTLLVNHLAKTLDEAVFKALFIQLLDHTKAHYHLEESLMDQSDFSDSLVHKSQHKRMLSELVDTNAMVQAGNIAIGRALLLDIPSWFENHTAIMDRALADHLKAKGLAHSPYQARNGA